MKTKLLAISSAVCIAVSLFTGCATLEKKTRVKPEKISPFIEKPELLTAQKPEFPFHYFYIKDNAGSYENVYIAPVKMDYLRDNKNWAKMDAAMAKQLGSDMNKIANYSRNAFKEAFVKAPGKKKLNVVNSTTQKKTLIIETAIVKIVPTKAELVILGTAANIFLPGISAVANQVSIGSVTMECIIRDAQTKEIVAMYSNTEKNQNAILNFAGMTWYTSAERNIQKQAENTAKVFSGTDYSSIRRPLIKPIAL